MTRSDDHDPDLAAFEQRFADLARDAMDTIDVQPQPDLIATAIARGGRLRRRQRIRHSVGTAVSVAAIVGLVVGGVTLARTPSGTPAAAPGTSAASLTTPQPATLADRLTGLLSATGTVTHTETRTVPCQPAALSGAGLPSRQLCLILSKKTGNTEVRRVLIEYRSSTGTGLVTATDYPATTPHAASAVKVDVASCGHLPQCRTMQLSDGSILVTGKLSLPVYEWERTSKPSATMGTPTRAQVVSPQRPGAGAYHRNFVELGRPDGSALYLDVSNSLQSWVETDGAITELSASEPPLTVTQLVQLAQGHPLTR